MTVPNYQFGKTFRAIFSYLPFLLVLLRWAVFWLLESSLGQFYESQGQKARETALMYSRKHIEDNAPGKNRRNQYPGAALIAYTEKYWPLLTPKHDIGCRVSLSPH